MFVAYVLEIIVIRNASNSEKTIIFLELIPKKI